MGAGSSVRREIPRGLILLSFVLVTIVHPPQAPGEGEHTNPLTTAD